MNNYVTKPFFIIKGYWKMSWNPILLSHFTRHFSVKWL